MRVFRLSSLRTAVTVAAVVATACDSASSPPDAAPPTVDAAPRGQGSEARGDLVVNELAPRGAGADWVELHNRGAQAIDLCGYFLTDAPDRLDHYLPLGGVAPPAPCPARLLDAGAYLVIAADDVAPVEDAQVDPEHAPFALGVADAAYLVTVDGVVADGVTYLYPAGPYGSPTGTLARVPDGSGPFFVRAPSPGDANPELAP
ncbi:MAG: lamin tail domain-containing protein [Kofleriaceae bacterium]